MSQDATGTVTIAAGKITSSNIGYSINTISKATLYENGILIDSFDIPYQVTLPPSNSVSTYTKIGTDSLYFQSGSMFMGGATLSSKPAGMKLSMQNGLLQFTGAVRETSTQLQQGDRVTLDSKGSFVMSLKKR